VDVANPFSPKAGLDGPQQFQYTVLYCWYSIHLDSARLDRWRCHASDNRLEAAHISVLGASSPSHSSSLDHLPGLLLIRTLHEHAAACSVQTPWRNHKLLDDYTVRPDVPCNQNADIPARMWITSWQIERVCISLCCRMTERTLNENTRYVEQWRLWRAVSYELKLWMIVESPWVPVSRKAWTQFLFSVAVSFTLGKNGDVRRVVDGYILWAISLFDRWNFPDQPYILEGEKIR
jgi:hypothetical protein